MFEYNDNIQWHGMPPPMNTPAQFWGRNPHPHDYVEGSGACENDCAACAWSRARSIKQREDLQMPAPAVTPTDDDMKFLADMRVSWYGDKRNC